MGTRLNIQIMSLMFVKPRRPEEYTDVFEKQAASETFVSTSKFAQCNHSVHQCQKARFSEIMQTYIG